MYVTVVVRKIPDGRWIAVMPRNRKEVELAEDLPLYLLLRSSIPQAVADTPFTAVATVMGWLDSQEGNDARDS